MLDLDQGKKKSKGLPFWIDTHELYSCFQVLDRQDIERDNDPVNAARNSKGTFVMVFLEKPLCASSIVAIASASVNLLCASMMPHQVAAAEKETPGRIVATQVRRQGFTCENPVSAKRDPGQSKPGETVWMLQCKTKKYRVRLVPKMAAKVEETKEPEKTDSPQSGVSPSVGR